ncbi:hypothetical protein KUA06_08745 [Proteus mirabilis]|uniref:hypothetical protein n=1 Tax=Proteus mirabilis TaxID=584 RepID=UPI002182383A|nr:hypothetical protein [Proteus mirabilis]MCT0257010.1 hypothetical protein [Proteus mirabilis]
MSVDSEQNKEELIEFFEKEKEKNNSNFLSKTRILALSLVPGVKQITQFRSDLIEYLDGNEVLRLVEFFYGINYKDNPDMLQALGPEYAEQIIDYVMKDTEKDKLEYYINLTLNISNSDFDIKERREITRILKSLSVSDIELAKKYYVYGIYELVGYQDITEQLSLLNGNDNGFLLKSINSLQSNGLIYDSSKGKISNIIYFQNTGLLNQIVRLICKKEEIEPIVYNEKEKEIYDILIINHGMYNNDRGNWLINELNKKSISAKIIDRDEVDKFYYYGKYFLHHMMSENGTRGKIIFELFNGYEKYKESDFSNINRVNSVNMKYGQVKDEDFTREIKDFPKKIANIVESFNKQNSTV